MAVIWLLFITIVPIIVCIAFIIERYKPVEPVEPIDNDIPYYINDEIEAIYNQISVYNRKIDYLENELNYTYNIKEKLEIEKKIADLKYKTARFENKVNKLLDKWEV